MLEMIKTEKIIVTQRAWQAGAGAITLLLLTANAPLDAQGWYYALLSLAATYVIFDHGLSGILTLKAASKFHKKNIRQSDLLNPREINQFHSLCYVASRKYRKLSMFFLFLIGPIGFYFFSLSESDLQNWPAVWLTLIVATSINLLFLPVASIIEGCGGINEVYKVRLLQGVLGSVACWLMIITGHTLWAAVALALAATITQVVWLATKWMHLAPFFTQKPNPLNNWDDSLGQVEKRVGVTTISAYLLGQAITIVLFQVEGPESAARMGFSLAIVNTIALLSFSTITSILPRLSAATAQSNWADTDLMFSRAVKKGIAFFIVLTSCFVIAVNTSYFTFLHQNLLPNEVMLILCVAVLCGQYISAVTLKIRCSMSEPLFGIAILASVLMVISMLTVPQYFGASGLILSLLIIQGGIALPLTIRQAREYENELRWTESAFRTATQKKPIKPINLEQSELIAILMTTFNGGKYLDLQLISIENQNHTNWELHISDDGSTDQTLNIIKEFQNRTTNKVIIYKTENNLGFVNNFFSLINKDIKADHFVLADQDDIWCSEKLSRSLTYLKSQDLAYPALYCGRTQLIDVHGKFKGKSPLFKKPPDFRNALVQSIAGGNTMAMNKAAQAILRQTLPYSKYVASHDWWMYIVITAHSGHVHYDPTPCLLYRQHPQNLIGANIGIRAKLQRLKFLTSGGFRDWNDLHLKALGRLPTPLSGETKNALRTFSELRSKNFLTRFRKVFSSGFYRQDLQGQIALVIAILFRKL
jgi:glycosyltransferase involved in cell wall biosynthesis